MDPSWDGNFGVLGPSLLEPGFTTIGSTLPLKNPLETCLQDGPQSHQLSMGGDGAPINGSMNGVTWGKKSKPTYKGYNSTYNW